MPSTRSPIFVLSCLHSLTLTIAPNKGDVLWCPSCAEYKRYMPGNDYRIKCNECTKHNRQSYGSALLSATTYATKHASKHPGHVVTVVDNNRVVSTHRHDAPTLDDIPPF